MSHQQQIAVIGGGVIGVCTAYFLAHAGHQVVVIERLSNVAEKASFGNAGVVAPGYVMPWATPGMPKKILASLFRTDGPVLLKPTFDRAMWRWVRQWLAECELDRFRVNKERMQRVASYSRLVLQQLREHHRLDYEQSRGYLQLFRSEQDIALAQPALELLAEQGVAHRPVDAEQARAIEPALSAHTPLAGGLYLPDDESGNCPLFTKQLKNLAQEMGVEFRFGSTVSAIETQGQRIGMRIGEQVFNVDAVVIAAGIDSARLLAPLGIRVPLYPIKGYSATATIRNFDEAPQAALMDESYKIAITRMGGRIRIAGMAELGSVSNDLHEAALRTLAKVGEDWFPDAANYSTASYWSGIRPMLPDGPPLLGATPIRNLYLNIGHGSTGWAMAAGCGLLLADIISGRKPDIDMEGLTLARYARMP
ncbi:MAG TPA: amino acid dehydrogenase [Oxalobacteraceae bacterium]|nr:amino acid dehydrogenase [Oxalobacteraceae bacterium]